MTLSSLEIGLIVSLLFSVIALVLASVSLFFLRRQNAHAEKTVERLSHEIALSTTGAVNMGQRLIVLEKRFHTGDFTAVAELQKTPSQKIELQKAESQKTEPQKIESQKTEPQKTEPKKTEAADLDITAEEFQPYTQAAELFKLGVECDEVARRCGLSRAEASLIQTMQLRTSV